MSTKRTIWVIDDNDRERRTYASLLEGFLPKPTDLQVIPIEAFPHIEDYLGMLRDPETACFIIDQRLKEAGLVDHTGIELATYLRSLDDKIPIFILTNFADVEGEFADGEWNVDLVISKGVFREPEKLRVIVARIVRHIDTLTSILGKREQRFRELVKKSAQEKLTEAELLELEDLGFLRASSVLAEEIPFVREMSDLNKLLLELHQAIRDQDTK